MTTLLPCHRHCHRSPARARRCWRRVSPTAASTPLCPFPDRHRGGSRRIALPFAGRDVESLILTPFLRCALCVALLAVDYVVDDVDATRIGRILVMPILGTFCLPMMMGTATFQGKMAEGDDER